MDKLQKQIDELKLQLFELSGRRITQELFIPGSVKNRSMGEANSYVFAGLAADLPTIGNQVTSSTSIYYALDTDVLYIWDGTQWNAH